MVKIFFHCYPQGDQRYPAFQHQLINIAFGLKELDIEYFSNIDYWKIGKDDYLFKKSNLTPDDCDVVVTSHGEFEYNWDLPKSFFKKNRSYLTVYIDTADGLFTRSFSKELENVDVILKQKSKGMWYPKNCKYPWTFGVSPYMRLENLKNEEFLNRNKEILANYRHVHTFRKQAEKIISNLKILTVNKKSEQLDYSEKGGKIINEVNFNKLGYLQSGGRFHIDYLKRNQETMACACFGGNLLPSSLFVKNKQWFRFGNYFYDNTNKGRMISFFKKFHLQIKHRYGIYQWDSWRLWETFSAKTVVVNIDFDKYGVQLPVMPVNFKHYIGVDLQNPKKSIEKINALSYQDLKEIAKNGHQWAIEYYSPKAMASRFLEILKKENV